MKRLLFLFVYAAATMILLSGCTASRLDADFGTSYKLAKFNQTLNPDAEKNLKPVYGLNGVAVQNIMGKYEAGFKEKAPTSNYMISVGGISAGQ